jgi:dipeptidyl aminopeptidase/acylaminoacyl peptidase
LVLPEGAEPAPLLLWVHGGPLASWNAWHWRWNPWVLAAQGYAVLLPDPALSTGYGQDFEQRGWGAWGQPTFDDLMAAVDAACAHPGVDASRLAAMGGSFGGYMANWIAGHTDRFAAIVTHASLWALDQFGATTDSACYWRREMTPQMAEANSPHRFVGNITTPMLVIHGDKDYRVPIGEACGCGTSCWPHRGCPRRRTAPARIGSCTFLRNQR